MDSGHFSVLQCIVRMRKSQPVDKVSKIIQQFCVAPHGELRPGKYTVLNVGNNISLREIKFITLLKCSTYVYCNSVIILAIIVLQKAVDGGSSSNHCVKHSNLFSHYCRWDY